MAESLLKSWRRVFMKSKVLFVLTGAVAAGLALLAQNSNPPASQGQGRSGAPQAWCDKNGDGICDLTGNPVDQGRGQQGVQGQGMGRRMGLGMVMRVSMLASRLNLTDAQKSQAITIFTNAQTAAAPVQTNIQTKRDELSAAVRSNNTGLIESVALALGVLQGQLTAIESQADAGFYAILTTEQKELYDDMPAGGGMGRGMGSPGGCGGPGQMGRWGIPPQ
jgi:hypothetical protein